MQLDVSPFFGAVDLPSLRRIHRPSAIDLVSLADVLRNSFVYPPHSIFRDVRLTTLGFDPDENLHAEPVFRFPFPFRHSDEASRDGLEALVPRYHQLLRDSITTSTARMRQPWLLQSGGKDSTSLAIALAEARPDAVCMTYMGGGEEDELASAAMVANRLGLRHQHLACDPGRAYDRYVAVVDQMPLLTADFAFLSYVDLATEIRAKGGDGIIDGLGSDLYFGLPASRMLQALAWASRRLRWPGALTRWPLLRDSFKACFLLGTLQMSAWERHFPGSRFTDEEVDALLGRRISHISHDRLMRYKAQLDAARSPDELHSMLACMIEPAAFGKGQYTCATLSLDVAYPYCEEALSDWIYRQVPADKLLDRSRGTNKILVREHIATRFGALPYVDRKGSFRFDLAGLARTRFDQVHASALDARDLVPGAVDWLVRNRKSLGNKYHASKFYLLAVALPWLVAHGQDARRVR